MEHTPKNILIKAVYEGRVKNEEKKREEYQKFLDFLGIDPILQ